MGNQQIRPSYLWGSKAGILFPGKTPRLRVYGERHTPVADCIEVRVEMGEWTDLGGKDAVVGASRVARNSSPVRHANR